MPATTFQNLGFETAGASPGLAEGWTLSQLASAEEIAGYGTPERPQEDFERGWQNDTFSHSLAPTAIEPALFDEAPESVEDFEEGWSQNESFITELTSAVAADYDAGIANKPAEAFEAGWRGNGSFVLAFAPADLSVPLVDGFEDSWLTVMTTT